MAKFAVTTLNFLKKYLITLMLKQTNLKTKNLNP
ncbi:hypothetical protein SAMN05443549_101748 [Flavobacterium fluvii]|uniref:Uncharacterized protein n=1 Tax=Flavobacterium fluvii TaxID=468056 RepID=A0A1M5FE53_9FLAO|nr:hypothetical protein SAMN05443549_101748 [Flavobacterium fluvii]